MHSENDSAESIARSDLEDGELRKMLASPLYRQDLDDCNSSRIPTAPEKPAVMIPERGASAKRTQADQSRRENMTSSSSQGPRASGKPAAMFSSGSQEPGNQVNSSIFNNAHPSNLGRSLLEGNEDHLLSQALQDQNTKLDLTMIVSVSFCNKLLLID